MDQKIGPLIEGLGPKSHNCLLSELLSTVLSLTNFAPGPTNAILFFHLTSLVFTVNLTIWNIAKQSSLS